MEERRIRTILVPTDFSESAARALSWARMLARALGARIVVLHVLDFPLIWMPVGGLGSIPTPVPSAAADQLTAEARAILETIAQDAPEVTERVLRTGHPREIILTAARELGADVIVMGTHGRRGVSDLFIGSVAEHVVRHSLVPVWTIRAGEPTPQG